jgi:AcrR family transcriptional regulator
MVSKRGAAAAAESPTVVRLDHLGLEGVPAVPPERLDPYLDAAAACFARFGITRTRVPDVAAEAGVSRVTIYRQVGTIEDMARLLLARDLHRLLEFVPAALDGRAGPDAVVAVVEFIVDHARSHPVLAKVIADEPHVLGPVLVSDLGTVAERVADVVAPLLDQLMASGQLAQRDPRILADWLVRQTVTLILAPPADLGAHLREVLEPALTPEVDR